ncbi:signal recognition particle subunit SRP68, partial [Lecanoromycetidae sp. Uapishka_2]
MDITKFVVSQREKALLVGDYGTYREQLSRRLLVVRRKLNYTSPKGKKTAAKAPVTAEGIANNHEYAHLLLLTSERAWAYAMHMKATHSADAEAKGITGSTKKHIGSRLYKATVYAGRLVDLLKDKDISKASTDVILEARAYFISLMGTRNFEKQNWEACLHEFSEARLIYMTLAQWKVTKQEDVFRDLLNTTIDPSIRYAAYQLKLPRTTSLDTLVSNYIPRNDNEFVQEILKKNPQALDDPATAQKRTASGDTESVPKTIHWRTRTVNLEDAATAQALAAVASGESNLSAFLSANPVATSQAKASAYDEVLIASQDAVDATKTAIDELSAEGVPQGDRRMQALQITRTAVNFALVGWRIGRNRILCGDEDGALLDTETRQPKKRRGDGKTRPLQDESVGRKLTRLKERVVLYDSTLQSLDSVKELPGVAADRKFVEELDTKHAYFAALRCLAIARSHALLNDNRNALALFSRTLELSSRMSSHASLSQSEAKKPPNLDVNSSQAQNLRGLLQKLVFQYRALVDLHDLDSSSKKARSGPSTPLVELLETYPYRPVDLTNLVTYPPKVESIPVKPLFLDVAFDYIDYPGRTRKAVERGANGTLEGAKGGEEKKEGKKGWFGFGR